MCEGQFGGVAAHGGGACECEVEEWKLSSESLRAWPVFITR